MKRTEIINKMSGAFHKAGFKLKKHGPEILIVAGIVGTVASAVMACKATLKVNDTVKQSKDDINKIHVATEKGVTESGASYSVEDSKKDLTAVYIQTGVKIVKLYAPAVTLGTLSIVSIVTSNNILRKRNVALAAAYATVDKSFKDYRGRVIERFGEKVDRELKYNIKAKEVEETVVDENGNEKKVTVIKNYINPHEISAHARFFDEYTRDEKGNTVKNPNWNRNNEYNLMFLKAQQQYANDLLKAKKRLFLNEVYEMLGFPPSKAGQVMGWVYNEENPTGDNYVDFGIYADNLSYDDYMYNNNEVLMLDFNIDGNVWESM